MTYTLKISHSIDDIDRLLWDSLVVDNVYMSWGWHKVVEGSCIERYDAYYFQLFLNEELLSIAVCSVVNQSSKVRNLDDTIFGRAKTFLQAIGVSLTPVFSCCPLRGRGTHIAVSSDLSSDQSNDVYQQMLDAIEQQANALSLPVVFSGVREDQLAVRAKARQRGYIVTQSYPASLIDITWDNFEDYRRSLSSRMRGQVNNHYNRSKRGGINFRILEDVAPYAQPVYQLIAENHRKHNNTEFAFDSNFISLLNEHLGDELVVGIAEKVGTPIGSQLILNKNGHCNANFIGIDHEAAGNNFTYFILAYYEVISMAIKRKFTRIDYGNAQYDLKINRGCYVYPTYILFKPRSLLQKLMLPILFFIHNHWLTHKQSPRVKDNLRYEQ